jgi:flagellar basal-body rod protein FlgB
MAISFKSALGIHEQALYLRADRAEVLANNLANADTPNFKARDIDFAAQLQRAAEALQQPANANVFSADQPRRTDPRHLGLTAADGSGELLYRVPDQPSIDGNTVEENQEMARFAKNGMDFQASLYFLNAKFRGLQTAIRGEV